MSVVIPSLRAAIAVPPWVKNELWRRAQAVPSLDLRFADNKSLVDAVTGASLVTFTRASSGTFVDSAGVLQTAATDVPRFDHNPTTGESLGLLVEEARTNLLLRSEEFDNASWGPVSGTVTANTETSPANTLTADKLIAANGGPAGQVAQGATITSGATVTAFVYAKAGGFDRLELVLLAANNTTPYGRSTFNPNTGVITTAAFTSNGGTNASSAVQALSNGWYRFSVTVTYPAVTSAGMRLIIFNSDAANGDGVKGVFLWGAQLEAGALPTSYIPTTTAAATRSADVCSITGSAFSSWYRQDEGTVFAATRFLIAPSSGNSNIVAIGDGTNNNRIQMSASTASAGNINGVVTTGGVAQAQPLVGSISTTGPHKAAFGYATNSVQIGVNGLLGTEDTSATIPTASSSMNLANGANPNLPASLILGRICFWPQRLANSTLQALSQ